MISEQIVKDLNKLDICWKYKQVLTIVDEEEDDEEGDIAEIEEEGDDGEKRDGVGEEKLPEEVKVDLEGG